jgi:hypothetical protein
MTYLTSPVKNRSVRAMVVALIITITAAYTPFTVLPAPKAHAIIGTAFEINPAVVGGVVATGGATTVQTAIMQVLNGLAWTIAKKTIQSITRSTVNWINSGFSGSPAFVSDLNQTLRSVGDAVANDFLNHLNQTVVDTTGFNLTSPFQDQLNQQLRAEYYRTTGSWGLNYTLSQYSSDPRAFQNGDFSKGGVSAFLAQSQNPANNPFGAYQLASNQLWSQIDAAAQAKKAELNWGQGFTPWRGNCNTPAAAASASSGSGKNVNNKNTAASGSAGKDINSKSAAVSLSQSDNCLFSPVKTPGSLIMQTLGVTATSPLRQLELADSINEIVSALMGQLVNQVLGPGGLSGASQPTAGGGSSPLTQATDPSQYNGLTTSLADGVQQNIKTDLLNVSEYQTHWQEILDAATAAQNSCGVRPDITTVINRANDGVKKGVAAKTQITKVQTEVQNAVQSTDYQSYLGSPSTPSAADQAEATVQSADTSTDTTVPQSLYSQMVAAGRSCGGSRTTSS